MNRQQTCAAPRSLAGCCPFYRTLNGYWLDVWLPFAHLHPPRSLPSSRSRADGDLRPVFRHERHV